jgi:hypothetical protein
VRKSKAPRRENDQRRHDDGEEERESTPLQPARLTPGERLRAEERRRHERCGEHRSRTTAKALEQLALAVDGANGLLVDDSLDLGAHLPKDAAVQALRLGA